MFPVLDTGRYTSMKQVGVSYYPTNEHDYHIICINRYSFTSLISPSPINLLLEYFYLKSLI